MAFRILGVQRCKPPRIGDFSRQRTRFLISRRFEAQRHTATCAYGRRRGNHDGCKVRKRTVRRHRCMSRIERKGKPTHAHSEITFAASRIRPRISYMFDTSPTASESFTP